MEQLRKWILLFALQVCCTHGYAQQQQVDNEFTPDIGRPVFGKDSGPLLLVDGGHHNFHTLEDKFAPFGKVATLHGFRLRSSARSLQTADLKDVKILVIANALHEKNEDSWQRPVLSAFSPAEINLITAWVKKGGRLFLIADHMPFAGAAADLAAAFSFSFYDGFALCRPRKKYDLFCLAEGTLKRTTLTDVPNATDSIVSFTGQAFQIPSEATSVLSFDSSYKVLMPDVAWEFNDRMKIISAEGLSQLAFSRFGDGKIVVAGEAAMFTAQRAGDVRIGLNAPYAPNNVRLLSNILKWLAE